MRPRPVRFALSIAPAIILAPGIVRPGAACLSVILMASAPAGGAMTPRVSLAPSEASSPSAANEIPKPIVNRYRWSQAHA
jgi:hypothetical protein